MRAAIYARVSQVMQTAENQLRDLRRFAKAQNWETDASREYVDRGVSGAEPHRPALDQLIIDGRRQRFDVVIVWSVDRLGRKLHHLIMVVEEWQTLGITFVALKDNIDLMTPIGRYQFHLMGAAAEFEYERTRERIFVALDRVRAEGKHLGRHYRLQSLADMERTRHLSLRAAAKVLGVSNNTVMLARREVRALETGTIPSTATRFGFGDDNDHLARRLRGRGQGRLCFDEEPA
jgi:DNA invertase Pin-like site-specific DNA recombinase